MTPFTKAAAAAVLTTLAILPTAAQSAAAVRKIAPSHATRDAGGAVALTDAAINSTPGSIPTALFEAALAAVNDDVPPTAAPAAEGPLPVPAPPPRVPTAWVVTDETDVTAVLASMAIHAPKPLRKPRTVAMVLSERLRAAEAEGHRIDGKQTRCLAENIYREARDQPLHGRYAIAEVTLNRVVSGIHPASICGTVYEPNQFTWTSDPERPPIAEMAQWENAVEIAVRAQTSGLPKVVPGALNYYDPKHAKPKTPRWVKTMQLVEVIKDHRFYKPKPNKAA